MRYIGILLVFFLIACGAPSRDTLESILIQDGDLPAGYSAGQISDGSMAGAMRDFDVLVTRAIQAPPELSSPLLKQYVTIAIYSDKAALKRDFKEALPGLTADGSSSAEIGENAQVRGNLIGFSRCNALVFIQLGFPNEALNFAKRLDERIKKDVC